MKKCWTGKWLFDGEEIIEDFAFIVEDGRIDWIGKQSELKEDAFDDKEDLGNRYITPGFVDAHVHVMSMSLDEQETSASMRSQNVCKSIQNVQKLLKDGIVACRDLGSIDGMALGIRDAIDKHDIYGPKMVAAGRALSATGGHGWEISIECDGVDEFSKGVRQVVKDGADVVKLMVSGGVNSPGPEPGPSELTKAEIEAGVNAAHALGRKVAVHTHGNTAIRRCVQAGVDSIEHGVYLSEDIMDMMIEKGTYLVPTFCAPYYAVSEGIKQEPDNKDHEKSKAVLGMHRKAVYDAFKKGVKVAMGSDVGTPFSDYAKATYELLLMVEAGFSPIEALTAATIGSAELLGIDEDYGTLKAGKLASFVSFSENPTDNIQAVAGEKEVYIEGEKLDFNNFGGNHEKL